MATIRDPPTRQRELFDVFSEQPGGFRPDRLSEVRPQERVLRRTVEQNVDAVTFPTLDVPMPQKVDQPLALLLSAHFPDPEQVLEVPKISLPSRPTRRFPEDIAGGGTVGGSADDRSVVLPYGADR